MLAIGYPNFDTLEGEGQGEGEVTEIMNCELGEGSCSVDNGIYNATFAVTGGKDAAHVYY